MHRVPHKLGIKDSIGMLPQLLQTTLNMLIDYTDE
jgi:hypothetical protein